VSSEAGGSSRVKGNVSRLKPLLSNGSVDVTANTSVRVCVCLCNSELPNADTPYIQRVQEIHDHSKTHLK
jgi:hypothetical protein